MLRSRSRTSLTIWASKSPTASEEKWLGITNFQSGAEINLQHQREQEAAAEILRQKKINAAKHAAARRQKARDDKKRAEMKAKREARAAKLASEKQKKQELATAARERRATTKMINGIISTRIDELIHPFNEKLKIQENSIVDTTEALVDSKLESIKQIVNENLKTFRKKMYAKVRKIIQDANQPEEDKAPPPSTIQPPQPPQTPQPPQPLQPPQPPQSMMVPTLMHRGPVKRRAAGPLPLPRIRRYPTPIPHKPEVWCLMDTDDTQYNCDYESNHITRRPNTVLKRRRYNTGTIMSNDMSYNQYMI